MKEFRIVFNYYLSKQFRSKFFLAFLIFLVAAGLASCFIMRGLADAGPARDLLVVDRTGHYAGPLKEVADQDSAFLRNTNLVFADEGSLPADETLRQKVIDTDSSSLVIMEESGLKITLFDANQQDPTDLQIILSALNLLRQQFIGGKAGISPDILAELNERVSLETVNPIQNTQNYWITFILYMLLILLTILFATTAASEVSYLKSNRVMEILITSIKPLPLYLGVTLAYGVSALIEIICTFISVYISYRLTNLEFSGLSDLGVNIHRLSTQDVLIYLAFFVLCFVLYSFLNTAVASIANSAEDSATISLPIVAFAMLQYFIAFYALDSDNLVTAIFSYIPFTSPAVMFVRYMMGYVGLMEAITAIFILLLSAATLSVFGAKLFSRGVVYSGTLKGFSLRESATGQESVA